MQVFNCLFYTKVKVTLLWWEYIYVLEAKFLLSNTKESFDLGKEREGVYQSRWKRLVKHDHKAQMKVISEAWLKE